MTQLESAPRLRILYVEDNALMREITSELLERDGREIVAVANGEEALAAFNLESFDIVITDVNLPVMSGLKLAAAIKQLAPSMPVILASGHTLDMAGVKLGEKVRALRKPFDSHQVDVLIAELCGGGSI